MQCVDPFYRGHERALRMQIFQYEVGDDCIQEPWITQGATLAGGWRQLWGVNEGMHRSDMEGGAGAYDPPLKSYDDMAKLRVTHHQVDEEDTRRNIERLQQAVGDILEVNAQIGCAYDGFMADISTSLAGLRGLEQVMEDMYDNPEWLHQLLAFMRDAILAMYNDAERAGDWRLTDGNNQAMPYAAELPPPGAHPEPVTCRQLWGFMASQELTLVSPAMFDEFMFQYQLPIMEKFGLTAYGCCEDLARKIDVLRRCKNLRRIAVTPVADVKKCAEQIGMDYVISWRPNPSLMVCNGWDEDRVRTVIRNGLEACKGQHVDITLKDVQTVENEPWRLKEWVKIVKETIDEVW